MQYDLLIESDDGLFITTGKQFDDADGDPHKFLHEMQRLTGVAHALSWVEGTPYEPLAPQRIALTSVVATSGEIIEFRTPWPTVIGYGTAAFIALLTIGLVASYFTG